MGAVEAFLLSARGLFVTVLAAPIVTAACLVLAVEAAEVGNRTWWDGSRPLNAAEAAAFGRAADLVRLLRRGDHPEQVVAVRAYNAAHGAAQELALRKLQAAAAASGNVFAELMETVKSASLGRISGALYAVGGQYRRNM